jgi:hypothetical protein
MLSRLQQACLISAVLTLPFSAGCSTDAPRLEKKSVTSTTVEDKTPTSSAVIEFTPAARAQIAKMAGKNLRTYVRLDFAPGAGEIITHIAIVSGKRGRNDLVEKCGDIECAFLKQHLPLAQGALIDWKETEKHFHVSFPNKTKENQEKSMNWLNEKRNKLSREKLEDRET